MSQAAWNICPTTSDFSPDCYFREDKTFSKLSGDLHMTLVDVPDGKYTLQVRMGCKEGAKRKKKRCMWA